MELARTLGELTRGGWRPRRTIVFASWDAEEFTLTSSTEWGEQHEARLRTSAVAYLNVDSAASGTAVPRRGGAGAEQRDRGGRRGASAIPRPGSRLLRARAIRRGGTRAPPTAAGRAMSSTTASAAAPTTRCSSISSACRLPICRSRARTASITRSTTPTMGRARSAIRASATTRRWCSSGGSRRCGSPTLTSCRWTTRPMPADRRVRR